MKEGSDGCGVASSDMSDCVTHVSHLISQRTSITRSFNRNATPPTLERVAFHAPSFKYLVPKSQLFFVLTTVKHCDP